MDTDIDQYFYRLGKIGTDTEATNDGGETLTLEHAIKCAVELALDTRGRNGQVMFIGNGGSAGIASHMATDWLKNGDFVATCFNDGAALTCIGNDLGYDQVFALPVERHARSGDLLVAISSSGKSPNILNGVAAARRARASVVTLSGFAPDNPLRKLGDINFWISDCHYGFVEIAHLALCHAILDIAMGWRRVGDLSASATLTPRN